MVATIIGGNKQTLPDAPADRRAPRRRWPAYGAAGWALLFAAQSLVAAILVMAGSDFTADTFGSDIARMARDGEAGFVATLWVAAVAKMLAAALALAPVRGWGRRLPRRGVALATYLAAGLVLAYGVINLVEHVLMQTGAVAIPRGLGSHALPWHLYLWDPYWILGGVLFMLAARTSARPEGEHPHDADRQP